MDRQRAGIKHNRRQPRRAGIVDDCRSRRLWGNRPRIGRRCRAQSGGIVVGDRRIRSADLLSAADAKPDPQDRRGGRSGKLLSAHAHGRSLAVDAINGGGLAGIFSIFVLAIDKCRRGRGILQSPRRRAGHRGASALRPGIVDRHLSAQWIGRSAFGLAQL